MNNSFCQTSSDDLFIKAWDNLIDLSIEEFNKFWNSLNKNKPMECKEALIAYVPLLAQKYSNAGCGLVSAYLAKQQKEEGKPYEHTPCSVAFNRKAFANSINYFCRRLFGV